MAMLITNLTNQDYWFGPLHLPGAGTLSVDDTTATSLYLSDDGVADAINFLYASVPAKVTVSGQASPFPRPTGTPGLLHGDGSPEGLVYASEGTLYLRRDNAQLYQKATIVHVCTGWTAIGRGSRDQAKRNGLGYTAEAFPRDTIQNALAFTSGDCRATSVGLLAGDRITNVLVNVSAAIQTITTLKVGVYDAARILLASSANATTNLATGVSSFGLSTPYVVPADGLYYLGIIIVATTMGSLGAGTNNAIAGKESAIGSGPKGAIIKTAQADIPATLGSTQSDQPVWLGWN
jgi:hypothetical protein